MRLFLKKWCLLLLPFNCLALSNMAYVEVNDHALSTAGCYQFVENDRPYFDYVSIFAANINGDSPNQAEIYFNPQVSHILNETSQVADLRSQGIKVVLTVLGNHQNAGWSCFTEKKAAEDFADKLANVIETYHLDGIDIDDEYSRCSSNTYSLNMVAKAMAHHPSFKNKIISKALFADHNYFTYQANGERLSDWLTNGWEMSYFWTDVDARLSPYTHYGMTKQKLSIGIDSKQLPSSAARMAEIIRQKDYAGLMIFNVDENNQPLLNALAQVTHSDDVINKCN